MILKALDNDCGIIFVDSLEDIYKVASFAIDDSIKDYSIEKEEDLLTLTYLTKNDKELKFAVYYDEFDLGLSTKPSSYIYKGGHTKLDNVFTEGQSYKIGRIKDDGSIVLKTEDGKGYVIPQKFIDMYFEPSSEVSRFEKVKDEKAKSLLDAQQMDSEMDEMSDTGDEIFY